MNKKLLLFLLIGFGIYSFQNGSLERFIMSAKQRFVYFYHQLKSAEKNELEKKDEKNTAPQKNPPIIKSIDYVEEISKDEKETTSGDRLDRFFKESEPK